MSTLKALLHPLKTHHSIQTGKCNSYCSVGMSSSYDWTKCSILPVRSCRFVSLQHTIHVKYWIAIPKTKVNFKVINKLLIIATTLKWRNGLLALPNCIPIKLSGADTFVKAFKKARLNQVCKLLYFFADPWV